MTALKINPTLELSEYEQIFTEKGVKFVNLSQEPVVRYDFGGRLGREWIPSLLLETHILIDLPVAKTHSYFRMSGALKNLFGLTPSAHKLLRYHTKSFADAGGQIFIDLYRAFPPDLVIVDGIVRGEGDGPFGSPKKTDCLLSSDDAICADLVLAEIMGYPVKAVPYLRVLEQAGLKPEFLRKGLRVEEVRPGFWKKPRARAISLLINLWRIQLYHLKVKKILPLLKP